MRRVNRTRVWLRGPRAVVAALLCSGALIGWPAAAQTQDPPAIQPHSGFQLDSVSAYTTYYPDGLGANLVPLQGAPLAPDVGMGAAATISWDHAEERSNISLTYTADYSGRLRYSAWDALNHMFSLNAARHFTPLWDFRLTVAAAVITADQLVLLPGELSAVSPVSSSLLLYGNRAFNSTAVMSLAYKLSTRTTLTWHANGTRIQSLGNGDAAGQTGVVSFLSQATTASAGFAASRTLSPRTQVSLDVGTTRLMSGFLDAWTQSATVAVSRSLSQRWFAAMHGGGGFIHPAQPVANLTTRPQYLAGGNLGYKTQAHTFQVTLDRTVGDSYGLGASTTVSAFGSWYWAPPGSPWSLRLNGGEQQLEHGVLATIDSRQIAVSVGRVITRNLQFTAEYGFMQYSGGALFGSISPSTVRVAMIWRPGLGLLH